MSEARRKITSAIHNNEGYHFEVWEFQQALGKDTHFRSKEPHKNMCCSILFLLQRLSYWNAFGKTEGNIIFKTQQRYKDDEGKQG